MSRRVLAVALTLLMLVASAAGISAAPLPVQRGGAPTVVRAALLRSYPGLLQSATGQDELADLTVVPIDPALKPDAIMRSRPFLLGPDSAKVFPRSVQPGQALTEDEARDRLVRFLQLRHLDDTTIQGAVARFDSRPVKRIVPAPTLRATLLMLTGWDPYQETIKAVLDGENPSGKPYRAVSFNYIDFQEAIATLYENPDGRHEIVFNDRFKGEPPEQLIPVLVHESLHGGGGNSAEEEIVANLLDTICYGEVLGVDPEAAAAGTELAIFNNIELMAMLNSTGRGGPGQVGVATSPLGDIFIGPDFADLNAESIRAFIESDSFYNALLNIGSPGQQTTAALISRFPGGKEMGPAPQYGEQMIAVIDAGAGKIITPKRAVALAELLGLEMTVGVQEAGADVHLATGDALSLKKRPFIPSNLKLFDQDRGKRAGKPLDESGGRAALERSLVRRGTAATLRDGLLTRYDDPATRDLIPDPSLRAAALLLGAAKPWDATLGVVFDGQNPDQVPLHVEFAPLRNSAPAARRSDRGDGVPPAILVNSLLVGEPPELLASVIVEGSLLHDDTLTQNEALAASLLGTLSYGAWVATDPDLPRARTWGVINRNRDLLALLNSTAFPGGTKTPSNADLIGFFSPADGAGDILPGLYTDATSFAGYVATKPQATRYDRHSELEAPSVFVKYLDFAGIKPTSTFRDTVTFSKATMGDLDAGLAAFLSSNGALVLARTLDLGIAAT